MPPPESAPAVRAWSAGGLAGPGPRRWGRRHPPSFGQGDRPVANDDVVEEHDVDGAERVGEAGGDLEVAEAGQGAAARVDMGADECGGVEAQAMAMRVSGMRL